MKKKLFLFLGLTIVAFLGFCFSAHQWSFQAEAQGDNLLTNGGFENGNFYGWDNEGMTVQSNVVHSGNHAVRRSGTFGGVSQWFQVTPGETYKMTAWVRIDSMDTTEGWGGLQAHVNDINWETLTISSFFTPDNSPTGEWFKIALTFLSPTEEMVLLQLGNADRNAVFYFDDVRVWLDQQGNNPPTVTAFADKTLGQAPLTVNFWIEADDSDGAIDYSEWDFGDGSRDGPPRVASTSHTYISKGTYQVRVTVFDDEGGMASDTISITVTDNQAPTVEITSPTPDDFYQTNNDRIQLGGTAEAASGLKTMRWFTDRGNGGGISAGTSWSTWIDLEPGENKLWVTVEDNNGKLSSDSILIDYIPTGYNGPEVSGITPNSDTIEQYEKFELTFDVQTVASNLQFPYEENTPRGIKPKMGVSVDGLFSNDDGNTWVKQPGFLYQGYERNKRENQYGYEEEHLYPSERPVWKIRFAPQKQGTWLCKIKAQDRLGTKEYSCDSFEVVEPTDPKNHGFIEVSSKDPRYFEFSDGTTFIGVGHNEGASTYDWDQRLQRFGENGANLFRIWQTGWGIYMAPWNPWNSHTLPFEGGYFNAPALTYDESFDDHLFSLRLWDYDDPEVSGRKNPCMFQGFDGSVPVKPNTTYQLKTRLKLVDVTGPQRGDYPYGFTIRRAGWLEESCSDPTKVSGAELLLSHVSGTKDWHEVVSTFTTGSEDYFLDQNFYLILENTNGGDVYIDEVSLREWDGQKAVGPEILRKNRFDYHNYYDQEPSWRWDYFFDSSQEHGVYIRPVILEKNDWIASHLGPYGNVMGDYYYVDTGNFLSRFGTMVRRLHEYYWRYQIARWGYSRSLHSFELLNEADPNDRTTYVQANDFGNFVKTLDPNKHLVSTSTWFDFLPELWREHEAIDSADWHAYIPTADGCNDMEDPIRGGHVGNDAALGTADFSIWAWQQNVGKPITRGEVSIFSPPNCEEAPDKVNDTRGVWLHNFVWAGINPGGMYEFYWDPIHIRQNNLYHIYHPYRDFMDGIPLSSGFYQDAEAESSNPNLRVWGQKDVAHGGLHLWVQNGNHTWRKVVDGVSISPQSGTIRVEGFSPGEVLQVEWWDTWPEYSDKGIEGRTETKTVDPQGHLEFEITNLRDDLAIRILPENVSGAEKRASRHSARTGEVITYTIRLLGTDTTLYMDDPIPAGLAYMDGSVTGGASFDPTTGCIEWSGTLTTGQVSTITFAVEVTTTDASAIVNTATITAGIHAPLILSALIIVNGRTVYLPIIQRRVR